ncbi:MAG: M6 family metalloprotease domain-containing protein [Gemmatimonadota bacterium]|nr:M6 family metalloprotease domain-containing protein [Gemmatimonadota bacterium]MDH3476816.1 M6 family metalloprotease domain-containing protein [Gemmatimonadota bacterium]MDH5550863.1 M6 family metalloprotease domain-containing protein [Gemmatimonadota bacterium]
MQTAHRPWLGRRRLVRLGPTAAGFVVALLVAGPAAAQTDVEELGRVLGGARPPAAYYDMLRRDPTAFQFSEDNGWIRRGREVARRRNAFRAQAAASGVSLAPLAGFDPSGVYGGELRVPVFLVMYANTDSAVLQSVVPRQALADRLYGTSPAPPYSIHTYYRELSNDRLLVTGSVFDWTRVSQPDTYYEAGCNGLCAQSQLRSMVQELVAAHDDSVDFGTFDNDGPDGVPNSGDDDGFVDAIVLMHPEVDGACKNITPTSENNIWAHKYVVSPDVSTGDPSNAVGGGMVKIRDYIIQGGQGGDGGCTGGEPQAMGVVAHETGHILGLPDLYDVLGNSAGIGHWGLMGSGNWNRAHRPAHMEAWSRAQLGWVSEVLIAADTTFQITPVQASDTVYVVPITSSNEYFLLENRQQLGSDSALHAPGLLIWHVDSVLMRTRGNYVNASLPHALALEQADGRNDMLNGSSHRGDSGDPFPGSTLRRVFGLNTNPPSARNDGTPTYIMVDSIYQVPASLGMVARLCLHRPSVVQASDTAAVLRVDGTSYASFKACLPAGSQHALEMDSVQLAGTGQTRYAWLSWSNGQDRSHTFTASAAGDSIIATVRAEHRVAVAAGGTGSGVVTAQPTLDLAAGEFVIAGTAVTLIAEPTGPAHVFEGWSGDTSAMADTLQLDVTRPFQLTATFAAPLTVSSSSLPAAVMGAVYRVQLQAVGGTGAHVWSVTAGTLPQGLVLGQSGELQGRPAETGTFPLTLTVVSGSQTQAADVQLEVSAPALAMADVLSHLVTSARPLTADDIAYLDLLGNRNGRADVGDFLAWVNATGQSVAPELAVQLGREGGERP